MGDLRVRERLHMNKITLGNLSQNGMTLSVGQLELRLPPIVELID